MADPRQHYVWRHYLAAWSNNKGQVHFLRPGQEPRVANPKRLMAEKGFYKLEQLDRHDIEFIEIYIEHIGPPDLRQHHRELLRIFALIANSNELIQSSDLPSPHEKKKVQDLVVNAEDMMHGHIEKSAISILDELRNKQMGFINSDDSAAVFFIFIAQQYCRTRNIRESIRSYFSRLSPFHNYERIANIMCYMWAVNLGRNLYGLSEDFEIIFLEHNNGHGFITGDQPVINLMANRHGGDTTATIYYYPLSPNLSCLVTRKTYNLQSKQVSREIVEKLNGFVALNSNFFIVGDSDNVIQLAAERKRSPNQSVGVILNYLAKDV